MLTCFCYRRSRALEHCQQMLHAATAGLEDYCPVCLLPCAPSRHAACQDHTHALPAPHRPKAVLQHTRHSQTSGHTGEHSLRHGSEQQQHYQVLVQCNTEQSLGTQQVAAADAGADNAAPRSQQEGDRFAAREDAQQQHQQQHRGLSSGHAEAAETNKEVTEDWVHDLPFASHFLGKSCIWQHTV